MSVGVCLLERWLYGVALLGEHEGARVDGTTTSDSGEEFRKGGVEIVGNEQGDNVLFAIGDNEKVAGAHSVEVVLPSGTREDARLGTCWTRSAFLGLFVHGVGFQCVSFGLLVQDHSHGEDRGRGMRWNVFDESRYDRRGIGGIGGQSDG